MKDSQSNLRAQHRRLRNGPTISRAYLDPSLRSATFWVKVRRLWELVSRLRARSTAVEASVKPLTRVRIFYQLSAEPLYTAGRDSFVTDLIRRAGADSVTADVPGAWPKYSDESALAAKPDAIILPTGGSMGEGNANVAEALRNSPAVQRGRVYKINDDHLVRPGPRAVDGLEEMAKALHPEAFK